MLDRWRQRALLWAGSSRIFEVRPGELPVAGFEVLAHLFLENLFEDCLHALADSGLHVQFHVMLELVFRGQVSPSSLNPQLTRHYLYLFG